LTNSSPRGCVTDRQTWRNSCRLPAIRPGRAFYAIWCEWTWNTAVFGVGRGAFGRVFLARQNDLANRLVALKVSADLFGESQTLAQLQHTNIVPVYSVHQAGRFQALCMPYFGATTLADLLHNLESSASLSMSGKALIGTLHNHHNVTVQTIVSGATSLALAPNGFARPNA